MLNAQEKPLSRITKVVYIIAITFLILTIVMISTGHAANIPDYTPLEPSLVVPYVNNNAYILASPVDITMLGDGNYTNVRLKPFNTPVTYDESMLFCGDVRERFYRPNGKPITEPMVIVYDKIGHHMFQSLACHDIISAIPVKESK